MGLPSHLTVPVAIPGISTWGRSALVFQFRYKIVCLLDLSQEHHDCDSTDSLAESQLRSHLHSSDSKVESSFTGFVENPPSKKSTGQHPDVRSPDRSALPGPEKDRWKWS